MTQLEASGFNFLSSTLMHAAFPAHRVSLHFVLTLCRLCDLHNHWLSMIVRLTEGPCLSSSLQLQLLNRCRQPVLHRRSCKTERTVVFEPANSRERVFSPSSFQKSAFSPSPVLWHLYSAPRGTFFLLAFSRVESPAVLVPLFHCALCKLSMSVRRCH